MIVWAFRPCGFVLPAHVPTWASVTTADLFPATRLRSRHRIMPSPGSGFGRRRRWGFHCQPHEVHGPASDVHEEHRGFSRINSGEQQWRSSPVEKSDVLNGHLIEIPSNLKLTGWKNGADIPGTLSFLSSGSDQGHPRQGSHGTFSFLRLCWISFAMVAKVKGNHCRFHLFLRIASFVPASSA